MLTGKGGLTTSKSERTLGGGLENTPILDLKTREVMSQGRQEASRSWKRKKKKKIPP